MIESERESLERLLDHVESEFAEAIGGAEIAAVEAVRAHTDAARDRCLRTAVAARNRAAGLAATREFLEQIRVVDDATGARPHRTIEWLMSSDEWAAARRTPGWRPAGPSPSVETFGFTSVRGGR